MKRIKPLRVEMIIGSMMIMLTGHAFGLDQPVLFDTGATGEVKKIETWGLDTAWLSRDNVHRGSIFMGQPQVDVIRFSFTGNTPVTNGMLNGSGYDEFTNRIAIVDAYTDAHTELYLNNDTELEGTNTLHSSYGSLYNVDPDAWAQLIDVTRAACTNEGRTVRAVSPFNEPDNATWQGDVTRFGDVCWRLRNTYASEFSGINIVGGNTLNPDFAWDWYNTLNGWTYAEEGCTHQLAGSFDNYAAFFEGVDANGDLGVNDELHNVMEAMVGVEYGMDVGIWWGTAERTRGEFVKASDGDRLAYAENRPNWTAASVYRPPAATNNLLAFVGESERQAVPTTYRFFAQDRPVFYDGYGPQRAYSVRTTGSWGYQTEGHRNAEAMVNISWGDDVQPAITNGMYYIVARHSKYYMELYTASMDNYVNIRQGTYSGSSLEKWQVAPMPSTMGGDYSYFGITSAYSGKAAEETGIDFDGNVNVVQYQYPTGSATPGVNQQWYFEYVEDGWFYIRNRWSGRYMEVKSAGTLPNYTIQTGELASPDSTHQQWRLIPVGSSAPNFTAPAAPTNVMATANAVSVRLDWDIGLEADLGSYTVLRSPTNGGPYDIVARGIATNTYTDFSANQTEPYYYVVKAVDQSLNRSSNSVEVSTTPTGADALVAHYSFEGDFSDDSINDNDCELISNTFGSSAPVGTAGCVPGGVGIQCLALDGHSGYVSLPAEVVNHDQITIAAWIYWDGGANWQRIFSFGNGEDQYMRLNASDGGGNLRFGITEDHSWNEQILVADPLPSDQWCHVAVTLSNTTATIFIDGTNVASSSSFTIKPSDFKPLLNYIGRSQFAGDALFKGRIDDFRIYNHALSGSEVADLADAQVVDVPVYVPTVVSWNLNDWGEAPNNDLATAGVVPVPYWNDTWLDGGNITNPMLDLRDNSGVATTMDILRTAGSYNMGPEVHIGADRDGTLNREILYGYVNGYGVGGSSITLTQIPVEYGTYDMYVYFGSDVDSRVGYVTDGTDTNYFGAYPDGSTNGVNADLVQATAADSTGFNVDANYAVFSGLSGPSQMVTTTFYESNQVTESYGGICAVQIVTTAPAAPAVPSGLYTVSSNEQVSLAWDYDPNASSYAIAYALAEGGPYTILDYTTGTTYSHEGLINGTEYFYVIFALGAGGLAESPEMGAVPSVAVSSNEFYIASYAIEGGTNISLTVSNSVPGHDYWLMATDTLTPPAWSNMLVEAGNGSDIQFGIPIDPSSTNRFFTLDVLRQ